MATTARYATRPPTGHCQLDRGVSPRVHSKSAPLRSMSTSRRRPSTVIMLMAAWRPGHSFEAWDSSGQTRLHGSRAVQRSALPHTRVAQRVGQVWRRRCHDLASFLARDCSSLQVATDGQLALRTLAVVLGPRCLAKIQTNRIRSLNSGRHTPSSKTRERIRIPGELWKPLSCRVPRIN